MRFFGRNEKKKIVKDLKNTAILNRARNSNLLKVTRMSNVRHFDKHVQKVLTDPEYENQKIDVRTNPDTHQSSQFSQ